jgi:hypothetical protein
MPSIPTCKYSYSEVTKLNSNQCISADALRTSEDDPAIPTTPRLRSGLYILRYPGGQSKQEMLYVIYWPQKTTWNDDAESSIRRNRVTFMRCRFQVHMHCITTLIHDRYLTKISHQAMALAAPEHASRIIWKSEDDVDDMNVDDDEDEADRMFSFEVSKTKEQDENVTAKSGFVVRSHPSVDNVLSK